MGSLCEKKGALDSQSQVIPVYQFPAHDRRFSPGTPASSIAKAGRHDIAEILLKAELQHQRSKSNQSLEIQQKTNTKRVPIQIQITHT